MQSLAMKFVVFTSLVASAAAFDPLRGPKTAKTISSTWTAGKADMSHQKSLMNVKYIKHPAGVEYVTESEEVMSNKVIPDSFDARTQWPECESIGRIRDQSQCGACWAVAAAEALTDRFCIASNGTMTPELSAEDALSCCGPNCGDGCDGGYPIRAWQWAMSNGLCTGSGFYEASGCKPYSIEPCDYHTINGVSHYHNCSHYKPPTPTCSPSCTNSNYHVPYNIDKYNAKSAYAIRKSVKAIQTDIMTNGPVEATFTVHEDFYQYKNGVYMTLDNYVVGGHAVKIIGWGTDNETPYWLVANSWGTDWGESGFFRILRGANECGFEEAVVAGGAQI